MYSQVGCDEAECGMIVARGQLNAHRKEKHGLHEEGESDKNEGPRMDTNSEPVRVVLAASMAMIMFMISIRLNLQQN